MIKTCKVCGKLKYFSSHKSTTCIDCLAKGFKYCVRCEKVLAVTEFGKVRLGLRGICKQCHRDTTKESVEKHKYNSNPNVRRRKAEQSRERYANDEAYRLACIGYVHNRRAKLIGKVSSIDWESCVKYFRYECAYCGSTEQLTMDHVYPVSKGGTHTITNIVCACKSCNSSKGTKDIIEWYVAQPFFDKNRLIKIKAWLGVKKE